MPSIDDFKIKKKPFESFRGWDTDIVSKLTISNSTNKKNTSIKNILEPNPSQKEAKLEPEKSQTSSKAKSNISQLLYSPKPKEEPNLSQEKKLAQVVSEDTSFLSLVGLQKKLVIYIYELCKHLGEKTTMPVSIENAALYSETSISAARKALQRLVQKKMVIREKSKAGRGGWTQYGLTTTTYQELKHYDDLNRLRSNYEPNLSQYRANIEPEFRPNFSSSSSLNKLTTKEERSEEHSNTLQSTTLPPEWESIDFSFLEDIGFNKNKLLQIYSAGKLSAEMVQESLYGYDFDRKNNNININNPIGFLMSQLRIKGFPYDLPKNYESPKVRAMRAYVERMEANEKKEQELKDALKTREFEKWFNSLSLEEQNTLVPPHGMFAKGGPRRAAFFKYFDENHWAEKEKVLFAGIFA